jgi:hypothetical protein
MDYILGSFCPARHNGKPINLAYLSPQDILRPCTLNLVSSDCYAALGGDGRLLRRTIVYQGIWVTSDPR